MLAPVNGTRLEYDIRQYKSRRNHRIEEADGSTKVKVAAGSIAGTVLPMLTLAKSQKCRLYNIKYGVKEMIFVSAGSIAGGLAAGLICDKKEHRKQKVNESVFQFMNASVPPLLTAALYSFGKILNTELQVQLSGFSEECTLPQNFLIKLTILMTKFPTEKLLSKTLSLTLTMH